MDARFRGHDVEGGAGIPASIGGNPRINRRELPHQPAGALGAHVNQTSFPRKRESIVLLAPAHMGPFSEEGPTIQRVHEYIRGRGRLRGKHHEIYLSDVRKASPDKWKTIIRQPMETARG